MIAVVSSLGWPEKQPTSGIETSREVMVLMRLISLKEEDKEGRGGGGGGGRRRQMTSVALAY